MTATIIDGKEAAKEMRQQLAEEVSRLKEKGVTPGLVVILIGDDPASLSYVRGKKKAAETMGMHFKLDHLEDTIEEDKLLSLIDQYNQDDSFHGILVQLPLPKHISEKAVIERISTEKDVDGFHPLNIGKMLLGEETFLPCTPAGIVELLKKTNTDLSGKEVVVIGRSNIVGKPVGQLLLNENATVTFCHSRTKDIGAHTRKADILIVAVGKAHFLTADQIKEGAIVIDVGVNRLDSGKLVGDVDFEAAKEKASYITPVPGGVGPMTITMLAHNTVKSAKNRM
ncbi:MULTISPECIES: bifunctional methylenetetrahydrofolate dehydrogenase/methenyltetrahydrofolate cyclohydrolase FolD [Bacillus]|uniref:Bifunctional protein FolD n=2 Tax=Bacillus TaxID=1386 RepID=A0A0M4FQQ8_9BACI|nr:MULTISPECIES: bifunctional methylenetetrahydrofolate dehydrogenase/methenyltetrahydrofolate cyclohydrolase FolD [Bacillus]ALC81571.1 5,10-methylene-tetrahydrofolate cyclohydrolase [Bacillus gobiensis]MBP1080609.1 methylenetetrahydrofolate dehydrogenase (NADP+)/methenyltetrahydrofolate cyclohydrolase [Bacillus capparidis]MED1094465.1 bifunctional methylenetetrahydrofolate dehydrogenase/methenyltetrahydrofolate cyclohydrolase FolD [Bacillus capparidis]